MTTTPTKTILGYKLLRQLGAGGFGEVWSAEAPGGLPKAVKLVYGFHDEHRAQTELKALERIKQIRHPFLLSLERIEVVDGQLVIVSELADGCLADIHQQYVENGEPGIPRDQLLAYIRDAAEALDYLSQKYSLQHLDVKPENLLVVGDHVKLADFGLVKDITMTQQSMVTGMTPFYAAPEIFDGKPGAQSDQYSLAVVYQEMLTSTRPFNGSSSAQLAAQHLHEKPDLSALPKSDRPLIAKALAKDPRDRFAHCRELVSELRNRRIRKKTVSGFHAPRERAPSQATDIVTVRKPDCTEVLTGQHLPFRQQPVQKIAPPDTTGFEDWLQPVLVVGVGGMAAQTLQGLKAKIVERHGPLDQLPALRLLCLDTDPRTLDVAAGEDSATALSTREIHCLNLKTSEYYRGKPTSSLKWLSRRWIYNIPKSLQTEGIRPLGRLAFADHFDKLCDAFRDALEQISRPENLAVTSDALEATPAPQVQPRVVVVSSMNGGAGGMLFDVGYLLRTLLIEEGFPADAVVAVLAHSLGTKATKAELSTANALATLSELRHFVDFGYPGDSSLGIPEFEDQPFGHVYLHELGEESRNADLAGQVEDISEWLYLNTLSNCAPFFDACRASDQDSKQFELRTFGMSVRGPSQNDGILRIANRLATTLIQTWLNGEPGGSSETRVAERFSLPCSNALVAEVEQAARTLGLASARNECEQQSRNLIQNGGDDPRQAIVDVHDRLLGLAPNLRPLNYQPTKLEIALDKELQSLAEQHNQDLQAALQRWIQGDRPRLEPIGQQLNTFLAAAQKVSEQVTEVISHCQVQAEETLTELQHGLELPAKGFDPENCLQRYHECREREWVHRYSLQLLRQRVRQAESLVAWLKTGRRNLQAWLEKFEYQICGDLEVDPVLPLAEDIEQVILTSHDEQVLPMESELIRELAQEQISFGMLLDDSRLIERAFHPVLHRLSLRAAAQLFRQVNLDAVIARKKLPPEKLVAWINEQLNGALPMTRDAGGQVRLLFASPSHGPTSCIGQVLPRHFKVECCSRKGTSGDFVFCFEGDGISLASVAVGLVTEKPRALDLGQRLHTRQDIDWSRIQELF